MIKLKDETHGFIPQYDTKMAAKAEKAAPPTYQRIREPGKLGPFQATLEQALSADAHRAKQHRRTAKALLAQITAEGYQGGCSQLTGFIRDWRGRKSKTPHAFVP